MALTGYDFKQKKMKKDDMKRLWSHLPDDILRTVLSKITLVDQIRFRAVCKNWQLPINDIRPVDRFPWTMLWKWTSDSNVCKLYDPSHQKTYVIKDGYKPEKSNKFVGAKVCASKYGWVLFSVEGQKNITFFVYSPFTNEVIELPELGMDIKNATLATFSSNPTSPDCVFFTVTKEIDRKKCKIMINTCHPGDKTWKTFDVDGKIGIGTLSDVTYMEGSFYCLFRSRVLGAFNVALQEWRLLYSVTSIDPCCFNYLVVSDGQLLRVHSKPKHLKWQVFRFDRKQKNWIKQKSLGNQVLFVGTNNSFSLAAVGEASAYADKIIFEQCIPRSLKTSSPNFGMNHWRVKNDEDLERVLIVPPQLSS